MDLESNLLNMFHYPDREPSEPRNVILWRSRDFCIHDCGNSFMLRAELAGVKGTLDFFGPQRVLRVRWVNIPDQVTNPDALIGHYEVDVDMNPIEDLPAAPEPAAPEPAAPEPAAPEPAAPEPAAPEPAAPEPVWVSAGSAGSSAVMVDTLGRAFAMNTSAGEIREGVCTLGRNGPFWIRLPAPPRP